MFPLENSLNANERTHKTPNKTFTNTATTKITGREPSPSANPINHMIESAALTHQAHLYALALKLVSNHDVAEDLVQEALYRAYRALLDNPEILTDLRMEPWLNAIITNTAKTYLGRKHNLEQKLKRLNRQEHSWIFGGETSEYDNPEIVVGLSEDRKALDELLNQLSPSYRQIIVERVIMRERYDKIAYIREPKLQNDQPDSSSHSGDASQADAATKRKEQAARTRLKRASDQFIQIIKDEGIKEGDLIRWFSVYAQSEEHLYE